MLTNHDNLIASEKYYLRFHQLKRKWLMLVIYIPPDQKGTFFTRIQLVI